MSYRISPVTHAIFGSSQTQNYTGSTAGQFVYFNQEIDAMSGISLSGSTGMNVTSRGDYLFNVSALFSQTSSTGILYDLWFRKNGVPVDDSLTRITIQTAGNAQCLAVAMVLDLVKGDTVELRWWSSSANGQLVAFNSLINPTRPNCPSIIISVTKVSE